VDTFSRRSLLRKAGAAGLAAGVASLPWSHEADAVSTYKTSLQPGESIDVTGTDLSVTQALTIVTVTSGPIVPPPPPPPPPIDTTGFEMGIDWEALPLSGTAYNRIVALAKGTGSLDQSNIDAPNTSVLLANAALHRRTGQAIYQTKVIAMLKADKPYSTSAHEPALQLGRNMAARAIAAAWVGYSDAAYLDKLAKLRTAPTGSGDTATMIATHERRGNNFSTCCGMSRIAIDLLIGDTTDLARAVKVHRGYVGERDQYTGFHFGDLLWQSDKTKPVGINPRGAKISTADVDGVLPDDQRRTAGTPASPNKANYVDQALGELLVTCALLGAPRYGDEAVVRAYGWLNRRRFVQLGDDRWQPAMANALYGAGTANPASGTQDGKSFGITDWLYS